MFDLIDECGKDLENYGYSVKKLDKYGISIGSLIIEDEEDEKDFAMKRGEYFILNCPHLYDFGIECQAYIVDILSERLKKFMKDLKIRHKDKVLIIGLGNPDVTADRLGKEVFDNVTIDVLNKTNNIYKFCPNIYFSTGIETVDMVEMLVKCMYIDYVIIIDSLTTNNTTRLGTSFQITTSGMTPGSGIARFNRSIDVSTMGVPCLSIGVPFMIFANDLNKDSPPDLVLSPKDIRENVEIAGQIIASTINEVLKWITIFLYHFFL